MCNTFYIWICINHCFSFAYLQFPFKKLLRSSAANTYITCCTFRSLALIYYSPTVIVLTFHAAFTQPNCPAKYFPLLTFNSRNLLPLCLSRSVGSVAVLFAELKWNKSRILLRNALQFTRPGTILLHAASSRTYEICLHFSRSHGGKKIESFYWLSII